MAPWLRNAKGTLTPTLGKGGPSRQPWVLKAVLNFDKTSRDRGEKGKERLQIVKQKKAGGMASSVWP